MLHPAYEIKRTFITLSPAEADFDDLEHPVTRKLRRCQTWDGQLSCCETSTDASTDDELENPLASPLDRSLQQLSESSVDSDADSAHSQGNVWTPAPSNFVEDGMRDSVGVGSGWTQRFDSVSPQVSSYSYVPLQPVYITVSASCVDQPPTPLTLQEMFAANGETLTNVFRGNSLDVLQTGLGTSATGHVAGTRSKSQKDSQQTVMLKNLPREYTRDSVTEMLDLEGFAGMYDFVHVPFDFRKWVGFGHAFVNLLSHDIARNMISHFDGFRGWRFPSPNSCQICWAQPFQGFDQYVDHYRNSPMMHESVPDNLKPAIFQNGQRIEFPEPTRRVRAPKHNRV